MATATASKDTKQPKPLPAPNSDFYQFAEVLGADELAILKRVRAFMETKVAPIINKYWGEDGFPFELPPAVKELNLGGNGILLDYNVARFFADAEALYSYEGTYQMQHLIVGKTITGFSAFV